MPGFVRSRVRPLSPPPVPQLAEGLQVLADFTGGLDLDADGFQVEGNKTSTALNVDFLPQGGMRMRDTVTPFNDGDLAYIPGALSLYEGLSAWMVASIGDKVWASSGPDEPFQLQAVTGTNPLSSPAWTTPYQWRCTQANGFGYLQNGYDQPRRWFPGSPVVTLTQNYNTDLENPTTGNMPIGRYCAMHRGFFWVAFTRESGVEYPDRIRWSHPVINGKGQECYRETDKVEVDAGADGQYITGLLAAGTELWVFKQHACYRLDGSSTADFALEPVSRDVGAAGPYAMAARGDQVWFWDSHEGLYVLNMASQGIRYGVSLNRVTGPLERLFRDHLIDYEQAHLTQVGCVGNKVWVNIPTTGGRRLFVFDPSVGEGAWTEYSLDVGMFIDWFPFSGEAMPVAAQLDPTLPPRVLRLDVQGDTDQFGNLVELSVPVRYRTVWASAEQPLLMKRWQSLELVVEEDVPLTVRLYTDWSATVGQTLTYAAPTRHDPLIVGESVLPAIPQEKLTPISAATSVQCLDVDTFPEGFAPVSTRPRVRTDRQKLNLPVSRVVQIHLTGALPSQRFTLRGMGLRWVQSTRRST